MFNSVLTFQRLVGDYILNRTGAQANGYAVAEAGVQFVQFPTDPYSKSGFYKSIEGMNPGRSLLFESMTAALLISFDVHRHRAVDGHAGAPLSCCEPDWLHCA